ncbi:MAG: GTPase HflX [Desulfobacteraceae bacterium]
MKKKVTGNTSGLKSTQVKEIENLYHYTTPPDCVITEDQARELVRLSFETKRQIGLLIDRAGKTQYVIAGEPHRIVIPVTPEHMAVPGKLKGLRCIHTHMKDEPLTRDDLTDLALLRLDFMAAVCMKKDGTPGNVYAGHILPDENGEPYRVLEPCTVDDFQIDCYNLIEELETELSRKNALYKTAKEEEKAFLINVATSDFKEAYASLDELRDLCKTSRINVIDAVVAKRKKIDSKYVLGKGKLADLTIRAIQKYATMLVFDRVLTPAQIRSITDFVEMKVIDRTQLILDIFAKQAKSREGKLQVELAQMEYLLPRLITKNTAMSRLTGGIGGRGPGETKLEINRRRVREKISRLNKEIEKVRKQRHNQRAQRKKNRLPVISIVGYTNAGKSTLLNALTNSEIKAADRLFATLDPSSRKLRFPRDSEAIITDTVGFIQNLPSELLEAFHATLEELEDADIILHVIDISNPRYKQQMESVDSLLKDLKLNKTPMLYVYNKADKIDPDAFDDKWLLCRGITVSATQRDTLGPLVEKLESMIKLSSG